MKLHPTLTPLMGLILGLSLAQPALAENVYKWVDKDGKVHYGDRPQSEEAEELKVTDRSVPVRGSSYQQDADIDDATPGANLMADASDAAPQSSLDAKQLIGRWQEDTMDNIYVTFSADGNYTRNATLLGTKVTLKGSWKLIGDELQVQFKSKSMVLPNGQSKTQADVRLNKSKVLSLSDNEMILLGNTKGGEMEFGYKKIGS